MDSAHKIAVLCQALGIAWNASTRAILCQILSSLADVKAIPCLMESLSVPVTRVVAAAAVAIGHCAYGAKLGNNIVDNSPFSWHLGDGLAIPALELPDILLPCIHTLRNQGSERIRTLNEPPGGLFLVG